MDSNHDIVPTLRMFDGVMMNQAADEIERLRALLAAGASEGQAEPIGYAKQSQLDGMSERRSALVYATACAEEGWNVPIYTHPSTEIAALRERIVGMEKDAERYRTLRRTGAIVAWTMAGPWKHGEALDAIVDRARTPYVAIAKEKK